MQIKDFTDLIESKLVKLYSDKVLLKNLLDTIVEEVKNIYALWSDMRLISISDFKNKVERIYYLLVLFEVLLHETYDPYAKFKHIKERTRKVLTAKNEEYAMDGDKLANFKHAAAISGEHPFFALMGMFLKHLVSIQKCFQEREKTSKEMWDEKLGDAQNYMLLALAICKEESENVFTKGDGDDRD